MNEESIEKFRTIFIEPETLSVNGITIKAQEGMAKSDDFNYHGRLHSEINFPVAMFQCVAGIRKEITNFIVEELKLEEGDTVLFDPNPSSFVSSDEHEDKGIPVEVYVFKNENEKDIQLNLGYEFYVKKQ